MKLIPRVPKGISRLIAIRLLLVGSFFCLILSVAQMFFKTSAKEVEVRDNVIQTVESLLPSISTSIYTIDQEQLDIQLNILLLNPNVRFAQVAEIRGNEKVYFKKGEIPTGYDFIVERPLSYTVLSDVRQDYGQLSVIATYDDAYKQLLAEAISIFVLSLIVVILLVLLAIKLCQSYIEAPLNRLSGLLEGQSVDNLKTPFTLGRTHARNRPDQIDRLEGAYDALREQYFMDVFKRPITTEADLDSAALGSLVWEQQSIEKLTETAIARSNVMEQPFVLMLFQLNNVFDKRSSHIPGQLLQIVAKRTLGKLRQSRGIADSGQHGIRVAHASDNKFMVIIENMGNRVHCISIARRLLELYDKEIPIGARSIAPEVSVGVCICPEDGNSEASILAAAELALDKAAGSAPQNAFVMYADLKN